MTGIFFRNSPGIILCVIKGEFFTIWINSFRYLIPVIIVFDGIGVFVLRFFDLRQILRLSAEQRLIVLIFVFNRFIAQPPLLPWSEVCQTPAAV